MNISRRSVLKSVNRRPRTLSFFINHPLTDFAVMVLIIASVVLLVFEETMAIKPGSSWVTLASEIVTGIFAIELFCRYWVAKKKARFFRRYWPDLLALLPLLRPLRFFRFFRLFRLFRLFQLGLLMDRRISVLRGVLRVNFYFLWILVVLTVILVVGSAVMAFVFEHRVGEGFGDLKENLWWAAYTIIAGEPVGGVPETNYGRILLAAMMLSGMTLFAIFTGMVSATMIDRLQGTTRLGELDIDELEDHIIICGWNEGAIPLIAELTVDDELRCMPLLLVNEREEQADLTSTGVRPDLVYHLAGDFTQLAILKRAGVERASRAVVLADASRNHSDRDRDARSVLAALTIERMNLKIYTVVELMDAENEAHLAVAGVEAVIMRNHLSGRALASACRNANLMEVMMNLLTLRRGETMHRLPGPRKPTSFSDLLAELKSEMNALLIGVESDGHTEINPDHALVVKPEDYLIIIGGPSDV